MSEVVYKLAYVPYNQDKYVSLMYYFGWWDRWSNGGNSEEAKDKIFLEYQIGKVTKPIIEGSCIYAFDSVKSAHYFIDSCTLSFGQVVCFECEYEPFHDSDFGVIAVTELGTVLKFWSKDSEYSCMWRAAPRGTVCCEWVKPIRIVSCLP